MVKDEEKLLLPMAHPGKPQTELPEEYDARVPATDKNIMYFRSMRSYRQFLDRVANQCYTGQRPMSDLHKAAVFAKVGAEIFLAENQLARAGLDMQWEQHPYGEDGGLGNTVAPRGYMEKTIRHKTGISKQGTPIAETAVTVTGVISDEDLKQALREIEDLL